MKKSSGVIQKTKRFRIPKAAEGDTPVFSLRLPSELRAAVSRWASDQPDAPGRSEAIRRIIEAHPGIRRILGAAESKGKGK
jgi:hypothetical protein